MACAVVQSLASESNRYSGRKERTQQRASFRDFSQAIEVRVVCVWVWLVGVVL